MSNSHSVSIAHADIIKKKAVRVSYRVVVEVSPPHSLETDGFFYKEFYADSNAADSLVVREKY